MICDLIPLASWLILILNLYHSNLSKQNRVSFDIFNGRNEVVAKVIFLHLFVILFTGGVCLGACWDTTHPHPPPADTPPQEQTPPRSRHPLSRHPPSRHPRRQQPQEQTPSTLEPDTPKSRHPPNRHPQPRSRPPQSRHPPKADIPRKQTPAYGQ